MARPALAAARSMEIMEFLARFPGRGFTLSEIVKGTQINLASCHAVLAAMEERGHVTRCPRQKSYRLGPVLHALGQVALASQPLLEGARAAAVALRDEFELPTLVSAAIGDEIVGIVACDTADGRSAGLQVGERMPLVPPIGASFLAWAPEEDIQRWLDRASVDAGSDLVAFWRNGLAMIRSRSFQVELRAPDSSALAARMEEMAEGGRATRYKSELLKLVQTFDHHPKQPDAIEPDGMYDLILIAAPIFDEAGQCLYNLCFGGFPKPIPGSEVKRLGDRLVSACLQVMQTDRNRT